MISTRIFSLAAALALTAALAVPAYAAEGGGNGMPREFNARMRVCAACHGENGVPRAPTIPIIAGQREDYVLKQIHDFDTGARKVEVMEWMAKAMTAEEKTAASALFAKRNWPAKVTQVAAAAAPRGVAVCQSCHQQNFMGAAQAEGMSTPRLAGQNYEYLVEEMRRFADGERANNADMVQIMKGLSAADRDAMAKYLAGL